MELHQFRHGVSDLDRGARGRIEDVDDQIAILEAHHGVTGEGDECCCCWQVGSAQPYGECGNLGPVTNITAIAPCRLRLAYQAE